MSVLRSYAVAALAVFALMLTPLSASFAQNTLSGEVLVDGQDDAIVARALGRILADILNRAGQDGSGADSDAARAAIDKAGDFVQSYTFRQELVMVDGNPTRQLYLNASFDRRTIQGLLKQGGVSAISTNAAHGEVALLVYGLRGGADYARVMSYLGQLPVVRKIQVHAADRDRLSLSASVAGAGDALIASVTDGGVLTWITANDDGRLEFELQQ